VATTQAMLSGGSALFLALEDIELLAHAPSHIEAAALAQAFTVVLLITAATVSLVTQARSQALARASAAELEADRRAAMLDTVVAHLHEGVVVVTADGQELLRNPAGRTILNLGEGRSYDDAMPGPEFGLFDLRGRRYESAELPHALALQGISSPPTDFRVRTPVNPEGMVLEITATSLPRTSAEEVPRAVINFRDVTEARRERDVLTSFAGVVAHDLNNPLTVASGWLHALRGRYEAGPVASEDALPVIERVERATRNMRGFIDDLLSYAVAENQQLHLTDVDLSEVVEDVATLRRGGDHPARIDVQQGLRVKADPVLMRQLMDNLVGNAVKYVAPGVVPHVRVSGEEPDADGQTLVSVVDNGIGVPDSMRRRIFESFERAHAQDYSGTGLGLAICRQIVERHGGTISVTSGDEGGSEFRFTLPAAVG
jgi:signal transduction histidine kinase